MSDEDRIEARRRGAALQPGEVQRQDQQQDQQNQSNQPAGSMSDEDRIEARRRGAALQPGEVIVADKTNESNKTNEADKGNGVDEANKTNVVDAAADGSAGTADPIRARVEARSGDKRPDMDAGGRPSVDAGGKVAGESGAIIPGVVNGTEPVSVRQIAAAGDRDVTNGDVARQHRGDQMMRRLGVEPPEDDEARRKREKRERWARISAAIGDGISAFANLWSTTQYGPNSRFVSASDRLGERYKAEKEERDKAKDAYFRAWQWFDKRERDQAAADAALKAAEWERQHKEAQLRQKADKDKRDGDRKDKELGKKIEWGDDKNKRENAKNKREEELHPLKKGEMKARTASSYASADRARASAARIRQQIRNGEQYPDLHLPNGKVVKSANKADYEKNVRRYAEMHGISTSWRADDNTHQPKSTATIHAELEHLLDWPETALVMGRKDTSFRDFYNALKADGFDPGKSMEDLAKELSTTKGRQVFFDRMAKAGVPVPRLKKQGNEVPDYQTWVAETPWLNAPSAVDSSAEAQSQIGIDTARVAAAPALVSVAAAGADKTDKTSDKTNEADKAAVGDKTDKANESDAGSVDNGSRYKHTEGLFGGG